MSETCNHKPEIHCMDFVKRYFQKEGVLVQTYRCSLCGIDVRFVKKPSYRIWDALVWAVLLGIMLLIRLMRDNAMALMPLWAYIAVAVAAVALLGLVMDMTREWFLLKHGQFEPVKTEPAGKAEPTEKAEDKLAE